MLWSRLMVNDQCLNIYLSIPHIQKHTITYLFINIVCVFRWAWEKDHENRCGIWTKQRLWNVKSMRKQVFRFSTCNMSYDWEIYFTIGTWNAIPWPHINTGTNRVQNVCLISLPLYCSCNVILQAQFRVRSQLNWINVKSHRFKTIKAAECHIDK